MWLGDIIVKLITRSNSLFYVNFLDFYLFTNLKLLRSIKVKMIIEKKIMFLKIVKE